MTSKSLDPQWSDTAYLERTSYHSQYPHDPWLKYRNPSGEFIYWLHAWYYQNDPMVPSDRAQPWAPLPWLLDERPNGDSLKAMYNIGVTARWPASWPEWDPRHIARASLPIYGVVLRGPQDQRLAQVLVGLKRQMLTRMEFVQRLNDHYVLFPKEKLNENSGSTKARGATV